MLKLFVWGENMLYNLRNDRKAVTAMEYAVIAAVTVIITAGGMTLISPNLKLLWSDVAAALPAAPAGG